MKPRRAIVLAAGFGSRMLPLTAETPKALLPFQGKPLLLHTLERLRDWGVREALVNTHHLAEEVVGFVLEQPVPGMRLAISHEPEILGTGGALVKAGWFVADGKPFWIVNADVVAALSPERLIRHHKKHQPLATLWMTSAAGPRTVEVANAKAPNGSPGLPVVDFASANPGAEGTATFTGLHLTDRRLLDFLAAEPRFESVIGAYRRAMAAGHLVSGVEVLGSTWADVGTPAQFLAAHAEAGTPTFVDPSATVAKGAVVENSVVFAGARLTRRAVVRNAVVGSNTRVAGPARRMAVPLSRALRPVELAALTEVGWLPALPVLPVLPMGGRLGNGSANGWQNGNGAAEAVLEAETAVCFAPRGSDRSFFRLMDGKGRRLLLMRNGEVRKENAMFAGHARFLAGAGVAVPEIVFEGDGFLLVEDLGDDALLDAPTEGRYRKVLEVVKTLHGVTVLGEMRLQRPFTRGYLEWEHGLFAEEFAGRWLGVSLRRQTALLAELAPLARRLARERRVLLHRDLQSTNVLFAGGQAHLIDFQGMRMGPAMYDVASLVADPYVDLPADVQGRLLAVYSDAEGAAEAFAAACVQRLLQALGAYGRLGARKETRRFLQHIPAGLRQLERAVEGLEPVMKLPRLSKLIKMGVSNWDASG